MQKMGIWVTRARKYDTKIGGHGRDESRWVEMMFGF